MKNNRNIPSRWPTDSNNPHGRNHGPQHPGKQGYGDTQYNTYAARNDHFVNERQRDTGHYSTAGSGYGNHIYSRKYAQENNLGGNRMVMGTYEPNDLDFSWGEPIQQRSRSWSNGRNRNRYRF